MEKKSLKEIIDHELFIALVAILFNPAKLFEQFWVEGQPRNIFIKLSQNPAGGIGGEVV